ncbi:MAG: tetratricopeptide repeat protein [Litoreibacter sp.]
MIKHMTAAALVVSLMSSTAIAEDQGLAGAYLAARQASFLSDYATATTYYSRAIAKDRTNVSLLDSAVLAFIGEGDIPGAAQLATRRLDQVGPNQISDLVVKAAALATDDFGLTKEATGATEGLAPLLDGLLRGWAILGQGQMSDALTAFEEVAEARDFSNIARYHEALALATVGDFESAHNILSGETYGPLQLSIRGILSHAQVLVQLERSDDALTLLDAALGQRFDAELNAMRKNLQAGQEVPYDFVSNAREGSAEVLFNLAAILNGRAAPEIVLTYARLAQHIRPGHAPAILTVAETLEGLEQYELATQAYTQVNRDHPTYFVAEMGRADALYADDRKGAAVEVLQALSKSHPDLPLVHAALGDLLSRVERREEALEAYTASLDLRESDERSAWRVYYARGIVHENLDNNVDMETDFRKALELNPNQPDVLNYLGYSLVEQKRKLDEALSMIETAVQERPDSGYITDSLAWIYYRLGRFEEAVAPMEKATELVPVDPIINDHLGDIYWMVGREREAEFQWKRALSFEPEESEAIRIRKKIDIGLNAVLKEEADNAETTETADN